MGGSGARGAVGEGGDPWEDESFEEFEAGAAAGAHEGNLLAKSGLVQGFDAVASADDALGAGLSRVRDGAGDGVGAGGELFVLEEAHGAVPEDGFGLGDDGRVSGDGGRADVEAGGGIRAVEVRVGGDLLVIDDRFALLVELLGLYGDGDDVIDGEEKLDGAGLGFGEGGAGDVEFVGFDEGLAGFVALGEAEGVGHGAADEDSVGLFEEAVDDVDLVGDLGAAEDDDEGAGGLVQFVAEELKFSFHEEAGGAGAAALGDDAGDAFGGGMSAMGGSEGIIDVEFGALGELGGEGGVVGLFLVVEAGVLEQEDIPVLEHAGGLLGLFADTIVGEGDGAAEEVGEGGGDGPEGHGGLAFAFGPAEVGAEDEAGAAVDEELEGGEGFLDAGGVGNDHLPVFVLHGDVIVDTDKHSLAAHIQVANGQFSHKSKAGKNSPPGMVVKAIPYSTLLTLDRQDRDTCVHDLPSAALPGRATEGTALSDPPARFEGQGRRDPPARRRWR